MIETIVHWLVVAVVAGCILVAIAEYVFHRIYLLKKKRARRLMKEIIRFYAASYVKGRITKEDFFQQARWLLITGKYHGEYTGLWQSKLDRYIEECTGYTPD